MLDYVVRLAEMGGPGGLLAELDERLAALAPRGPGAAAAQQPPPGAALDEVERRAAAAFAAERWREALAWYGELCRAPAPNVDYGRVLLAVGRCLLYLEDHAAALVVLERVAALRPDEFEGQFYLGRACQLLHRYEAAIDALTRANLLRPGTYKCLLALAQSHHGGLTGGYGVVEPLRPEARHRATAEAAYRAALAASPKDRAARVGLARLLAEGGRVEAALDQLAKGVAAGAPARPLVEEANLIALRAGRLDLAGRLLGELRACAPNHPLLGRLARMGRELRREGEGGGKAPAGPPALVLLAAGPRLAGVGALLAKADLVVRPGDPCAAVEAALRVRDEGLVALGDAAALRHAAREWRTLAGPLARGGGDAAGVAFGGGGTGGGVLWRRAALLERLARAGADAPMLAAYGGMRAGARLLAVPARAEPREAAAFLAAPAAFAPGAVALVSRNGHRRFGGGEHFLREAAAFYAAQGCRTLLVGVGDAPRAVAETLADGTAAYAVPDDAAALREVLLREGVGLVHALSGLGHLCAEAVGDSSVRLVYGIHHWREFLQSPANHDYYYPYVDRRTPPHPAFGAILRRADAVYANSPYVAELCQRHLGLLPVEIPSAVDDGFGRAPEDPADPDAARARALGEGFVLLVNARADKGYGLALDVAERLPDARFVAVASQSSLDAARCALAERGLRNVTLARRFDDMAPLYRRARAVLVPSFRFVETFSRAVLEAQRLGVPVVGADAGNVPNLLAGTGAAALPEDAAAWAEEVARLVRDDAYHAARSAAARRAAAGLSSRVQAEGLARVYASLGRRILVAVGSGVGNVCHTTPLVRRLAEHAGAPVDVLVAGDFPGCGAAVFRGAPWVASVFEAPEHALSRTYDLAVVTHSFGRVLPPLSCRRLLDAREVAPFDPTAGEHEVDVNLRLLEKGLGVPVREGDRRGYFVGTHRYAYPASGRIALHAGCKGGPYLVKRWPHFEALARELGARGHEVVSVGTADEHVPGTGRAGGGTLEDTVRELLGCDALVTNDSGVMNLANALGVPTAAVFGPSSARVRGPVNAPCLTFQAPLACSPCEERPDLRHRFTQGLCTCIGRIGLEDVLGPLTAFLDRQRESHAAGAVEEAGRASPRLAAA